MMMSVTNNLQFGRKAPLAQRSTIPSVAAKPAAQPRFGMIALACDPELADQLIQDAPKLLTMKPSDVRAEMLKQAQALSGNRSGDPVARSLLKNGVIPIVETVTPAMSVETMQRAMLLVAAMRQLKERTPIRFMITSPGGYITGMNGVISVMDMLKKTLLQGKEDKEPKPIVLETYVNGYAASAATLIAANGTKGHRFITGTSEYMIHQPLGGSGGQATEIEIQNNHIQKYKQHMIKFFAERCNLSEEEIAKQIERDNWKSAERAVEDGFLDHVADAFPGLSLNDTDVGAFSTDGGSNPFDAPDEEGSLDSLFGKS
jgi:ATP-dependent Clp protease, protease subunit